MEEQILMKYLLAFVFFIASFGIAKSDQFQILSKQMAEDAREILLERDTLVEWCHCCDSSLIKAKKYVIQNVELAPEEPYSNWYQLKITVRLSDGSTKVLRNADLAYLHIQDEDSSVALATYFDLGGFQCADPFQWDAIEVE